MASAFYDQLTCPICLDLYTDPVRLQCFHVFCRKCIGDSMNVPHRDSACPECKALIGRNTTVDCLKKDFKIDALVQALKETPKCSEHNEVVNSPEEHRADALCCTCCKLLCVKCAFNTKHKGHDMDDLEKAVVKQKDYFEKRIPAVKRKMEQLTKEHSDLSKTKTKINACKVNLHCDFLKMIRALQDCVNKLQAIGQEAIQKQVEKLNEVCNKRCLKLSHKLQYGKMVIKCQENVGKDLVTSARVIKTDAVSGNVYLNSSNSQFPINVTSELKFRQCPAIEEGLKRLLKLVNEYILKIQAGTLEKSRLDLKRPSSSPQTTDGKYARLESIPSRNSDGPTARSSSTSLHAPSTSYSVASGSTTSGPQKVGSSKSFS